MCSHGVLFSTAALFLAALPAVRADTPQSWGPVHFTLPDGWEYKREGSNAYVFAIGRQGDVELDVDLWEDMIDLVCWTSGFRPRTVQDAVAHRRREFRPLPGLPRVFEERPVRLKGATGTRLIVRQGKKAQGAWEFVIFRVPDGRIFSLEVRYRAPTDGQKKACDVILESLTVR